MLDFLCSMSAARRRVLLLVIIYAGFISLGLPDTVLGVAWQKMRLDFGSPVSYAGFFTFLLCCFSTVSSLSSGYILRRFGTGRLLAVCGLATGLALVGCGLAGAFWIMLLMAVPLGFGQGAVDTGMNHYVAKHYTSRDMNWLHCCWGVGASAGPGLMTVIIAGGCSWRYGYWIIGAVQIMLALVFAFTLPLWRGDGGSDGTATDAFQSGEKVEKDYRFWCCPAMFFLYTGIEAGMGLWGYMFLTSCRGVDGTLAGYAVTGYWCCLTAGRFLIGFLANRLGNIRQQRFSMIGAFLCGLLMLVPQSGIAATGFVLCGFMFASFYPAMMHMAPERFNAFTAATVIGFQGGGGTLGVAVIPALLGFAAGRMGFVLLPCWLLVSALAVLGMGVAVDGVRGGKNRGRHAAVTADGRS
ncbi:MAG: sugar MFS transporter [Victivallaceae bacterium]|nr:MFS transporter [Victivallaceae bacterium]